MTAQTEKFKTTQREDTAKQPDNRSRRRFLKASSMLGLAAAFSPRTIGAAFADSKSKDSGNLNLANSVQVGSTQVAPGDYKVEWNGTGDNVQVNILKGKNVVATTEGKLVELPKKADNNSVTTKALDNNTRALMEIQFDNRKESLVFNQGGTTSGE